MKKKLINILKLCISLLEKKEYTPDLIYKENTYCKVSRSGYEFICPFDIRMFNYETIEKIDERQLFRNSELRRTGRTTIRLDKIVQLLFRFKNIYVYYGENNYKSQKESELLLEQLMFRLLNEHNLKTKDIEINNKLKLIKIINIDKPKNPYLYPNKQ